ncbi:MAG TPA: DUF1841 family protein [Burkholderiales bacterium]|jgi:hypothetical protein|nr:DUF1841 family protein [Burkholderiales bacterium]
MFAPTREQARQFFFETWRRYRAGRPLEGLQQTALPLLLLHPEYHPLLDRPEHYLHKNWLPDEGALNPFLHLSLHLAVQEQLAIDQPRGIRALFDKLRARLGEEHDALHALVECLGETMWQAQRATAPPDEHLYLECVSRRLAA